MNLAVGSGCRKPGQPLRHTQEELGKVNTKQSWLLRRHRFKQEPPIIKAPPAAHPGLRLPPYPTPLTTCGAGRG